MKNTSVIWRSTHFAVRRVVTLIQTSSLRSGKMPYKLPGSSPGNGRRQLDIATMDPFVVPRIGFDQLYAFVVVRPRCARAGKEARSRPLYPRLQPPATRSTRPMRTTSTKRPSISAPSH